MMFCYQKSEPITRRGGGERLYCSCQVLRKFSSQCDARDAEYSFILLLAFSFFLMLFTCLLKAVGLTCKESQIKVAEHSFPVPMRYLSLFSIHWQLGSQNWQGASSTKEDCILMFYWTRYRYHGNTAGGKPALNNGFDLFSENSVVRFFPSFVSRKLRKILAYYTGLVKF